MTKRILIFLISIFFVNTASSQSKDEIVRFLRTRIQAESESGKFISVTLVGTHFKYRYYATLTTDYSAQKWIQEIDLDLSKLDDAVVKKDDKEVYWVKLLFGGPNAVFYDIEYNSRKQGPKMNDYEIGFSKDEAYKVQKYFKKLAKMCGAKVLEL